MNKRNTLLYKKLGKREPNFPIMLSWDSQSGMPYWVYKFVTSEKYTIKKTQKGSPEKTLQAKNMPIYRIKCFYVRRDFPEDLSDHSKRLDVYFLSS